ncbi:hypothetical protein MMC13_007067 [Lambiella insularis]|nr:hypothetical protein [Lambiella insularis]
MNSLLDAEQFTLISTPITTSTPPKFSDSAFGDYEIHASGPRTDTLVALNTSLRARHPKHTLTFTQLADCNLLGFASAGFAQAVLDPREGLSLRSYVPPARKLDGEQGFLAGKTIFAKYAYRFGKHDFLVYAADGTRQGTFGPPVFACVLCEPVGDERPGSQSAKADELIAEASKWSLELHGEVWMFDQMFWRKDKALWEEVQKASWDDVILDDEMKGTLQNDIEGFYDERENYEKFKIAWKRGIIFYGPPGNGKTISIKAMMKNLANRPEPVPTLYVKSFMTYNPEYSIRAVFRKARSTAPCLLIFEDVDSLITPQTRSYFLNEIDGLEDNGGILMLGSTNHLDRLDPGIAKRPSRFDRKYLFPMPSLAERIQYCQYWRAKLASNPEIEFPKRLCTAIAKITDKFSFAYMKEAFVATLLALVVSRTRKVNVGRYRDHEVNGEEGEDDLDDLPLWKEMKKQVKTLKNEIGIGEGMEKLAVREAKDEERHAALE